MKHLTLEQFRAQGEAYKMGPLMEKLGIEITCHNPAAPAVLFPGELFLDYVSFESDTLYRAQYEVLVITSDFDIITEFLYNHGVKSEMFTDDEFLAIEFNAKDKIRELHNALLSMKTAAENISTAWDEWDGMYLAALYPFDRSYDELVPDISAWVALQTSRLAKQIEEGLYLPTHQTFLYFHNGEWMLGNEILESHKAPELSKLTQREKQEALKRFKIDID